MLPAIAAAVLPVVFGFHLGEPVSLPECDRVTDRHPPAHGAKSPYSIITDFPCQMMPAPGEWFGRILFPGNKVPELAGSYMMVTAIDNGRLEAIYTSTMRYDLADTILARLTQKFGRPTESGTERVMVRAISIASPWARWARPGYTVEYHAIGGRLEHGALAIETDRARAAAQARLAAGNAGRIPL
jgi:hypothetical protein